VGIFTKKSHISVQNAQIGEDLPNGDICWNIVDFEYAWALFLGGVLEDRGYRTVNGIHYRLFYLPPPRAQRQYP
jgi:hypothetical protein